MSITVDNIEQAISKHPLMGMALSVVSSIGAQIQEPGTMEYGRQYVVQLAADLGIIVALFIGLLTLAIKIKDFYKKYFLDRDKSVPEDE